MRIHRCFLSLFFLVYWSILIRSVIFNLGECHEETFLLNFTNSSDRKSISVIFSWLSHITKGMEIRIAPKPRHCSQEAEGIIGVLCTTRHDSVSHGTGLLLFSVFSRSLPVVPPPSRKNANSRSPVVCVVEKMRTNPPAPTLRHFTHDSVIFRPSVPYVCV